MMGYYWKFARSLKFTKKKLVVTVYLVSVVFFCLTATIFSTVKQEYLLEYSSRCPSAGKGHFYLQNLKNYKSGEEKDGAVVWSYDNEGTKSRLIGIRKLLGFPGSSPPRCISKCGKCTPCRPVHVPVPPGTPVTAEYYPEAWRCKCGNKLYMP